MMYADLKRQDAHFFTHDKGIPDQSVLRLDRDLAKAIEKLNQLEAILANCRNRLRCLRFTHLSFAGGRCGPGERPDDRLSFYPS